MGDLRVATANSERSLDGNPSMESSSEGSSRRTVPAGTRGSRGSSPSRCKVADTASHPGSAAATWVSSPAARGLRSPQLRRPPPESPPPRGGRRRRSGGNRCRGRRRITPRSPRGRKSSQSPRSNMERVSTQRGTSGRAREPARRRRIRRGPHLAPSSSPPARRCRVASPASSGRRHRGRVRSRPLQARPPRT